MIRIVSWQRGFTLLELLVVLLIVGVMSAFVVPKLSKPLSNLTLKTATKQIASSLRYARNVAVTESRTIAAFIDLDMQRVYILAEKLENDFESVGYELDPRKRNLRTEILYRYELPLEVRVNEALVNDKKYSKGRVVVLFYPNGGSSGGEILVAGKGEQQYNITVNFVTGSVLVNA